MTETTTLRQLLLPELEEELQKTRKMINHLPDGPLDYKPHEKSFNLARLAGHTAEMAGFITMILTTPDCQLGVTPTTRLTYETKPQLLAEFNELADKTVTALKDITDETFHQLWKLTYKGHDLYSGTRYNAYRSMGLNHMIHHRAQLGVYLRLLDSPVPATFGPSADEPFTP